MNDMSASAFQGMAYALDHGTGKCLQYEDKSKPMVPLCNDMREYTIITFATVYVNMTKWVAYLPLLV